MDCDFTFPFPDGTYSFSSEGWPDMWAMGSEDPDPDEVAWLERLWNLESPGGSR